MFSVRIVSTDHYMSAPVRGLDVHYADQRGTEVKKVPVVRIYGSTPAGQKTCMHVHGVFPYLYIPYDGTVPWDRYLRQVATSLDKAINVAQGHGQSNFQHVYKIVLVTGRAMYGYHDKEQQFLKIYFYSPSMIKKAADLLLGGAVLNKPFQPHEAHIPYTLQLFIDYNLYGMNMINVAAVKFRRNGDAVDEILPASQGSDEGFNSNIQSPSSLSFTALLNRSGSMTPSQRIWEHENIPGELYLDGVERLSTCALEVDVVAADIINRLEVGANIGTNPGLAALWEDERQRCRDRGETTEIAPPESQERTDIAPSDSDVALLERLQEILMELQPYMDSQPSTDSSQESDFPLTQASQLDLHLSQVESSDSQDTDIVEDEDNDEPIVNVESIKKVVSLSQSFSNVRPDLLKVSSDDKSLVDILASLADQHSPSSSQNAASDVVALEEQDSILSQLSQTRDEKQQNEEEEEILEMSQCIWDGEENKIEDGEENYDMAGMDDTWVDSQLDIVAISDSDKSINDEDNVIEDADSDADSDIIPQYDGPPDEKVGASRGAAKRAILKRLGMRGPVGGIHGTNRGGMTQYDARGNMLAANPFADDLSPSSGYNAGSGMPQFANAGGWNQGRNQGWVGNMEQNYSSVQTPSAMTPSNQPLRNYHTMQHSVSPVNQFGQSTGMGHYHPANQYSSTAGNQLSPLSARKPYNKSTAGNQLSPVSPGNQFRPLSGEKQFSHSSAGNQFSPVGNQYSPTSIGNQCSPTPGTQFSPSSAGHQFHPQSAGTPFNPTMMQSIPRPAENHKSQFGHSDSDGSKRYNLSAGQISPGSYQRYQGQFRRSSTLNPTVEQSAESLSPRNNAQTVQRPRPAVSQSNHSFDKSSIQSHASVNQRLSDHGNNVVHHSPSHDPFSTNQCAQQVFQNPGYYNRQNSSPLSYESAGSRPNKKPDDLSALYSRVSQVSAQQTTNTLTLANEVSRSQSHDLIRANKMPQHRLSQNYDICTVASSQDGGFNEPYQSSNTKNAHHNFTPMPINAAQHNSAISSSHMSSSCGRLPLERNNREPLYSAAHVNSNFSRVSCDSTSVQSQSSSSYSVSSSEDISLCGINGQAVMSNILIQRLQKSDSAISKKCGLNSDTYLSQGLGHELDPLSGQMIPRTVSQYVSPKSLSNLPSSISSPSVKTSEPFVGPITKYYHRKLMYEQISPPATPGSSADDSSMKSLLTPSPSSVLSEPHVSPLQKLLLEPLNISSERNELGIASPSRSSLSNLSSPSSEKPLSNSQQDIFSQGSVRNPEHSRLFNLLSSAKENIKREELLKSNENLNDSQLDLFADSLISDIGSADNNNTADSLTSLFSDDVPVTPLSQTQRVVSMDTYRNNCESTIPPKGSIASLSSLENFVGSVRNESSEFGVNFNKTSADNKIRDSIDSTRSDPVAPSTRQPDHRRLSLDNSQNNVANFNMAEWSQYSQSTAMPVQIRGGLTKRRGRPSLKKSMSTPVETFGPVQKKRRGRPRKKSDPPVSMPTYFPPNSYQVPAPPYQTHYMNSSNFMAPLPEQGFQQVTENSSNNLTMNMPYYSSQQSFSELLEGDGSDLLAEFTGDSNLMNETGQSDNQFSDNMDVQPTNQLSSNLFCVGGQSNIESKPLPDSHCLESNSAILNCATTQSQSISSQNDSSQCLQYQSPSLHEQQPLTTINLSEAINISEPPANFDPEFTLPRHPNTYVPEQDERLSNCPDKMKEEIKHSKTKLPNRMSFQGAKLKHSVNALKRVDERLTEPGTIMELIRYRQHSVSPPKMSPAYTFRFKVPTPFYKKLKFRVKHLQHMSDKDHLDFVRMHPKDARKYSLLKIGREMIQLKNLSKELIDDIKNKLKSGAIVEGIPPAIRSVEVQQTTSIIADLLSVESPISEDKTATERLDDLSVSSHVIDMKEEPVYVMKKQHKEISKENKDKKHNSMFRGGSIGHIPHLKKYRAGFPYFGKGSVGRGRQHGKVRPNKKGLKPEYEDDEDVVLKDVSLNDASEGTLTPIKSRTPIAGRSPAHYVGNIAELDQSEKEILESRLYDLDLNQSGSAQMFQDELFGSKEAQKTEFENAAEDIEKTSDKDVDVNGVSSQSNSQHSSDDNNLLHSNASMNSNDKDVIPRVTSDESGDMSDIISEKKEIVVKLNNQNVHEPMDVKNESLPVQEFFNDEVNVAYGKFKKHFEMKLAMCRSLNAKKDAEHGLVNSVDESAKVNSSASVTADSNSTCSSNVSSLNSSEKNSALSRTEDTNNDYDDLIKHDQDSEGNEPLSKSDSFSKKRKQSSGSISGRSRRNSRTSSTGHENNKKSNSKLSSKKPRYDSDSDGIPGVDYIVTNKFKGHKELRVVVDKLKIEGEDNLKVLAVKSVTDKNKMNEMEDGITVKVSEEEKPGSLYNGFSAEFEKFIASQINAESVLTDSDTDDCDIKDKITEISDSEKVAKKIDDNNAAINGIASGEEPASYCEYAIKDSFGSCESSSQGGDGAVRQDNLPGNVKNGTVTLRRQSYEAEGMLDFSSSSEDEQTIKLENVRSKKLARKPGKKKKANKSIHDGSVFCSKARKRRPKPKSKATKLMSTLSILHDATMEKLTSSSVFSDVEVGTSSSNQSPVKSQDISDVDSPVRYQPRVKTPDFELYGDKTDDHDIGYEDTMYKLSYLSPMSSDSCSDTPPRPLSPKEMLKLDGTVEQINGKTEHNEQRLTFADIIKTMHADVDSNMDVDASKATENPSSACKIAVAKTETLTLKDIKSLCQVEKDDDDVDENADGEEEKPVDSPPPDLGPPVLESSAHQDELDDGSPPPQLTPNRSINENCFDEAFKNESGSPKPESNQSTPPFLMHCLSPQVRGSPVKCSSVGSTQSQDVCAKEVSVNSGQSPEKENIAEAIKKLPVCSSSGSINVIHSEEFSDISDSEDEASGAGKRNDNFGKPKYTNSPTMPCLSPRLKPENQGMLFDKDVESTKMQKLQDIKEFEERLRKADLSKPKKSDENRNNIFELMSSPNSNIWSCLDERSGKHIPTQSNHEIDSMNPRMFNLKQIQGSNPDILKFKERLKNSINNVNDNQSVSQDMKSSYNPSNGDQDYIPTNSAAKLLYDMSQNHVGSKNHVKNGELDFVRPKGPARNGEYQRSLSQNDYVHPFNRRHSSSEDLANCSMELNYAALERTENGKHNLNHRNFFSSFHSQQRLNPSEVGANSGDLFESSSEVSHIGCERSFPTFNRSLSDSARSEYSIVRCNRLNDSIMKSVHNIAVREKSKLDLNHGNYTNNPFIEFGSGDGKKRPHSQQSGNKSTASRSISGHTGFTPFEGHSTPDGSGNGRDDIDRRHEAFYGSSAHDGCNVITPYNGPPSLERILESANEHGLGAYRQPSAFYSNYRDMPEKPREGGGLLSSVQTTLVKELGEFETSLSSVNGIKHWRTVLCAKDSVLSSQTGSSDLLDQLEQEPALKYALTGDQSVIITPCNLPPSFVNVEKWNIGREIYKTSKHQAAQKEKERKESDKIKEKTSDTDKLKKVEEKLKNKTGVGKKLDDPEKYRLNLFTGRRELASEAEFTKIVKKPEHESTHKTEEPTVGDEKLIATDIAETDGADDSKTSKNMEEVESPYGKSEELPSSPGNVEGKSEDVLHSTPMLRRGSTDLFEPECTPISSGKRSADSQENQTECFVTPKRIRPLRRLSTNTDTQLRKSILTSQIKLQYGTPGLARADTSQIDGPSLKNSFGFKHSQRNLQDAKSLHEYQHLTIISVEIHADSRGDLKPNPEFDAIQAIFYSVLNDVHPEKGTRNDTGVFIVDPDSANHDQEDKSSTNQKGSYKAMKPSDPKPGPSNARNDEAKAGGSKVIGSHGNSLLHKSGIHGLNVTYVKDENELFRTFIDFIHRWDPDILVGYEIQMLSWGYLLHRASTLNMNLTHAISRIPSAKGSSHHSAEKDEYGADHMSEIHISGRIVLNLWRLLRHEVTLNVYSFENVMFHVLHRRVPLYPFRNLTAWFKHRTHLHRWKVMDYYKTRVKANLELMDQLDIVGRTSEFARVFGIEFYHVLSRGSQYRVESMMLRVAKPMNYIPASPSVHQRARMKAPECIPLTLEPESRFYTDPVVVVDFQSLYPSIMIAYNYCFSTCLGRLEWFQKAHEGPITFGCTSLELEPSVIQKQSNKVSISPNGVVFCKQSVKRGVLPVMVEEILNTRLMVKKAMSKYKDDKTLSRMLHARQMGLKLIANVTYGYTGANFSGRMPCIEVADSIVRKARETLERSIKLVEDTPRWGARVVYGDTDSMFIELKGKSKDEAFKIGQDIAKTVTEMFPKPIKLKFEKVYLPCVLQTKKRYVGFMYETPDQKEPVYDAKGIETVRRDNCSAVSKILERSIKVLFTTKDVSQVKSYVQQQCQKVLEGNVSLQDFVFAKEYRGVPGYKPGACVPALEIAKKLIRQDCRSEPRVGERVPYVIVYGSPGLPLIQLVRQPLELLHDSSLRLNSTYYINKQILPPLDRFLSLMGVNVFTWYQEIPHSSGRLVSHTAGPGQAKKGTISQYFATSNCPLCDSQTKQPICVNCMKDPQLVCFTLNDRITRWERVHQNIHKICGSCIGTSDCSTIKSCQSLDCPVQFRRSRAQTDVNKAESYRDILSKIFQ